MGMARISGMMLLMLEYLRKWKKIHLYFFILLGLLGIVWICHALYQCSSSGEKELDAKQLIRSINQKVACRDISGAEKIAASVMMREDLSGRLKFGALYYLFKYYADSRFGLSDPDFSRHIEIPYEETMITQLAQSSPPFPLSRFNGDFRQYLSSAIGFEKISPIGGEVQTSARKKYGDGTIELGMIRYKEPNISVQFRYACHKEKKRSLLIILHGHLSFSSQVFGLKDPYDYMEGAGKYFFDKGFDVIAFDLTYSASRSAILNSQLLLYGVQIYGLWARAIEDVVSFHEKKYGYTDTFLYGFSNGGIVADHLSVLSSRYRQVIVGDILKDWRRVAHKNETIWARQNYAIFYLKPLLAQTSYVDFFFSSGSPKTYTMRPVGFSEILDKPGLKSLVKEGVSQSAQLNFVIREVDEHRVDLQTVQQILSGELEGCDGYHIMTSF